MNFLFCSVGRRGELLKNFKGSLDENSKIIATDNKNTAPALYFADKQYIVPKITDENYISIILDICIEENINVVTTFIDPEIEILAEHSEKFNRKGIKVLAPSLNTAKICFNKYLMYKYLINNGIKTPRTYNSIEDFMEYYDRKECNFPVFVKPRTGSGSVGARRINNYNDLKATCLIEDDLIIQEFMDGIDLDADVYIDTISNKPVSIFTKKKIETKIGGANKTISFKDEKLFRLIIDIISKFKFNGPIDMDFFYKNGEYFLNEINPRFGGAYLHAYGCGVNFIDLIINNVNDIQNTPNIGDYEEDIIMMMYDSVIFRKERQLATKMAKNGWGGGSQPYKVNYLSGFTGEAA